MVSTEQHPTQQELQDFVLGRLTGSRRHSVEAHIADCDQCCAQLRGSVPDDTFAERFKGNSSAASSNTRVALGSAQDVAFQHALPTELQNHARYRIVKEVGRGGMGVVYLAEHTFMERQVALKVISSNLVANTKAIDRFRQEVKAAARLSHANIVTAHDAEEAGGHHFLVMEYVEGISLAKLVQKRGPLSASQASNVMKQVARGLQHAHEKGMVHRDIKPQNLLITKKGQIKILDFGLAKLLHSADDEQLTDVEMVLGTPDYIAPEQASNSKKVDIRSDLYSLGCTFYYLLTGHAPFRDGTAMDKMIHHTETVATPVHQLRPDVPNAVSDIVAKLMAKKPAQRFQTPSELLQALTVVPTELEEAIPVLEVVETPAPVADTEPLAQAPTIPTPPRPLVSPLTRKRPLKKKNRSPSKRFPLVLAGIVAASILLLGGGVWAIVSALKDDKATKGGNDGVAQGGNSGTPNLTKENNSRPLTLPKNNNPPVLSKGKTDNPDNVLPKTKKPLVALLIPSKDFWYPDYYQTRTALEALGAEVKVIATEAGFATHERDGGGSDVRVDFSLKNVQAEHPYDALLVLGGSGVDNELRASEKAKQLLRDTIKAGKVVGSQCVGAALLAEAGVFQKGQIIACPTQFPWAKTAVTNKGVTISQESVEVSGKMVTARRPEDGRAFAKAVMDLLQPDSNP